jgi:peptide deformylase
MMRKILQLGDPRLEKQSKNINNIDDPQVQKLIDEMIAILKANPEQSAGLSAPQLGELEDIIVCRRIDKETKRTPDDKATWEVMINPKITFKGEQQSIFWEGCLSVKNGDLFGEIARPDKITVEYQDRAGNQKSIPAKGYLSHIIQHEIDHLLGILFVSYINDPSKLLTNKELDELYASENQ